MKIYKCCPLLIAVFWYCHADTGHNGGIGKEQFVNQTKDKELTREKRAATAIVAAVAAVASAAAAGGSLVTGAVEAGRGAKQKVMVELEIVNTVKWPLTNPKTYIKQGVVLEQARLVHPGMKEMMVMRKKKHQLTGSKGSVSWDVAGRQIIVCWSAPWSFAFSNNNRLGITVVPLNTHTCESFNPRCVNDMNSYGAETGDFSNTINTLRFCDDVICVTGTMGTSHKPEVHITVFPKYEDGFAESLREMYSCSSLQHYV